MVFSLFWKKKPLIHSPVEHGLMGHWVDNQFLHLYSLHWVPSFLGKRQFHKSISPIKRRVIFFLLIKYHLSFCWPWLNA
jgi:hypothetical protein